MQIKYVGRKLSSLDAMAAVLEIGMLSSKDVLAILVFREYVH
jgi:hypothetical protein